MSQRDGECRADADRQHARLRHRGDVGGQVGELVEQLRQSGLIGAARRGGREPVGLALEQRHAEALLEQLHHPADRGGGDVQFAAAPVKLPERAAASNALMPLRNGSFRIGATIKKSEPWPVRSAI